LRGKRCLIIGGRQSAFEWAALAREQGAVVHVCHRHDTPKFMPSDWSWVNPLVEAMVINPGWFRNLTADEKQAITHHMWMEGRAKLEPWLWPRLDHDTVKLWPNSRVVACEESSNGGLIVQLDNGRLTVDHIILATGYKTNVSNLPLLAEGNVLSGLTINNGYPILDEHFQSSVPGLYFTGFAASQDFGPFFGFTVAVRASAQIIGASLVA
jgi:thioredoxin reductase